MPSPVSAITAALCSPSPAAPVGNSRLLSFLRDNERNSSNDYYAHGVQQRLGRLRGLLGSGGLSLRCGLRGLHGCGLSRRLLSHLLTDAGSRLLDRGADRCCNS